MIKVLIKLSIFSPTNKDMSYQKWMLYKNFKWKSIEYKYEKKSHLYFKISYIHFIHSLILLLSHIL